MSFLTIREDFARVLYTIRAGKVIFVRNRQ